MLISVLSRTDVAAVHRRIFGARDLRHMCSALLELEARISTDTDLRKHKFEKN